MELSDRAARALMAAATMAVIAVAIVAVIRAVFFVLDAPGWWSFLIGLTVAGGASQWIIDRPRESDDGQ